MVEYPFLCNLLLTFLLAVCYDKCVRALLRAAAHRDLYAPKRIFLPNTASNCHGRRQPCRGSFSCLMQKSFVWGCFAVLNCNFFFIASSNNWRNTLCISKLMGDAMEEKVHSKPYQSLSESAQAPLFLILSAAWSLSWCSPAVHRAPAWWRWW